MAGVIIFDPNNEEVGLSVADDVAVNTHLDIESDTLYFTDGAAIREWEGDTATRMTCTWKSGQIRLPSPINLGAAIVEAEHVSVDVQPNFFILAGEQQPGGGGLYRPMVIQVNDADNDGTPDALNTWAASVLDNAAWGPPNPRRRFGGCYDSTLNMWFLLGNDFSPAGSSQIMTSDDAGATWTIQTPLSVPTYGINYEGWSGASNGSGVVLLGMEFGVLLRTTDGSTFTQVGNTEDFASRDIRYLWYDSTISKFVFLSSSGSGGGGLYESTDSTGTAFGTTKTLPNANITTFFVAPGGRWFVGDFDGQLWYSDNQGGTWTSTIITADWSGFPGDVQVGMSPDGEVFVTETGSSLNQQKFSTTNGNAGGWTNKSVSPVASEIWYTVFYWPNLGFVCGGGISDDAIMIVNKTTGNRDDNVSDLTLAGSLTGDGIDGVVTGPSGVQTGGSSVTFKLYADGVLKHTQTVTSNEPFRLPGGYLSNLYEIEIISDIPVTRVSVAESIFELAEG